jgi:hypothetical protein
MFTVLNSKSDVHYREVSLFIAIHFLKFENILSSFDGSKFHSEIDCGINVYNASNGQTALVM